MLAVRRRQKNESFLHIWSGISHMEVERWMFNATPRAHMILVSPCELDSLANVGVKLMVSHFFMPQNVQVDRRALPREVSS
jgi:hypothetical protein